MYEASIQNINGEVLLLTGNEAVYQVLKIDGLDPPKGQINMTTIAGLDGAMFNSSKLETRNIVLTIKINGDVEANRLKLYEYFITKEWCKFFYSNSLLNVSIEGYVDDVICDLFTNSETAQISIICPDPYFRSVNEIINDISNTLAQFVFPFTINLNEPIPFSTYEINGTYNIINSSQSETGLIIEVIVETAINSIEITNTQTNDDLELDYPFQASDKIIINTNKGQKSVTLIRDAVSINLFSAVKKGSTFLQLHIGMNEFGYLADGGTSNDNVKVTFRHFDTYRGV